MSPKVKLIAIQCDLCLFCRHFVTKVMPIIFDGKCHIKNLRRFLNCLTSYYGCISCE